jgi:hypothetical protein
MATYAFLFVNDESFRDRPKDEVDAIYAEIARWSDDLTKRGILKGGMELQRKRTATTVRRVNGTMTVIDGPFIESKEHIGGFALIEVADRDEAIRIAKAFPGSLEVRPVVEH